MQSGKQRRVQIKAARLERAARRRRLLLLAATPAMMPLGHAAVSKELLAPDNSYGAPAFVQRGYYQDIPFSCVDCGETGVWTAERQKWWYEVAKGNVWTTARRCKSCRAARRALRETGRRTYLEGMLRKAAMTKTNAHTA